MSTIKLKGSSSGEAEVTVAAAAGTPTFTLPTTVGSANQLVKNSGSAGTLEYSAIEADSNGDLGLGTTPNNFGSYRTIHIKGPSGEGAAIRLQDNGDTADSSDAAIYKNGTALYLRVNGTDPLIAYMNGAERLRIKSDGAVDLNASPAKFGNSNNSGGTTYLFADDLRFTNAPLTATHAIIDTNGLHLDTTSPSAANGLNDYEEGTFVASCSNSITLHSGGDTCSYTRIGRSVTVRGQIAINSSNSNSEINITNMPFANENTTEDSDHTVGVVRLWNLNISSDCINVICMMTGTGSNLQFWNNRDNNSATAVTAWDNAYLAFTITYFTDA